MPKALACFPVGRERITASTLAIISDVVLIDRACLNALSVEANRAASVADTRVERKCKIVRTSSCNYTVIHLLKVFSFRANIFTIFYPVGVFSAGI